MKLFASSVFIIVRYWIDTVIDRWHTHSMAERYKKLLRCDCYIYESIYANWQYNASRILSAFRGILTWFPIGARLVNYFWLNVNQWPGQVKLTRVTVFSQVWNYIWFKISFYKSSWYNHCKDIWNYIPNSSLIHLLR